MAWGCWQQVTPLEVEGRTLPLVLTSQHGYQGLRDSKTPRGASLVPSCVCPRAVCSKTRLDFLAFCWSVLSEATQEAPASLRTITAPHSGSVPRAAWAEFTPAPCVSRGPVSPASGAEQRRGQRQPWPLALKYPPRQSSFPGQHREDGPC